MYKKYSPLQFQKVLHTYSTDALTDLWPIYSNMNYFRIFDRVDIKTL